MTPQRLYYKGCFDGIVAKQYVENFEEVQAKQPIVFLQDISKIEILVDTPETVMATIRREKKIEATATFAVAPEKKFPLQLKSFPPTVSNPNACGPGRCRPPS